MTLDAATRAAIDKRAKEIAATMPEFKDLPPDVQRGLRAIFAGLREHTQRRQRTAA